MTLATVLTPGYVSNDLVYWLIRQDLQFSLIEQKPRERAKMEAMKAFLDSGADRWLLMNHYASPQFELSEVPDRPVLSALMQKVVGTNLHVIHGKVYEQDDVFIRGDFVPTGCLFLQREVVEKVKDQRPFEYRHATNGELEGSGDRTLSDALIGAGFDLWIWKKRCLNRQECFI